MTPLVLIVIHLYRWTLKPLLHTICGPGCGCRYEPSCSLYGLEAVRRFGAVSGLWLTLKRIGRCHPWGGCGYDPVPKNLISH